MSNKISIKRGDVEISIEGDVKFVEKHLSVLKKEFFARHPKPVTEETLEDNVEVPVTPDGGSLLNFYNEKKPQTHYDKIVTFAYYLMENAGKKAFSADDIGESYLELRKITKMPGSLKATLQDTFRNTGYIKRAKKGHFELTPVGINYVNHQLPPRGN